MSIEERVKLVIAEVLAVDVNSIASDASIRRDLGASSMDAMSLILTLEDEFGGTITPDEAEKLTTVGEITIYIKNSRGTNSRHEP